MHISLENGSFSNAIQHANRYCGTCRSPDPGSERRCATQKEKPKSEWSTSAAGTYAKNCRIEGTEVGSEKWCENLGDNPKGEWSADEAKVHAKHCVLQ